jgi:hypothetical protein
MIELVKNPAWWFPFALVVATGLVAVLVVRMRRRGAEEPALVARALHAYHGCVIGVMGTGHLAAVIAGAADGTLRDGLRWHLIPLGLVIALPGWWLVAAATRRGMLAGNLAIAAILIPQGPSAVLAVPAIFGALYLRWPTRVIPVLLGIVYVTLFAIALVVGGRF